MGRVERIFLRPSSRTPVKEVRRAEAKAGAGLVGDHAGGGNRQVTLVEAERWADACRELGRELDPAGRRANLVVSGVSLAAAKGAGLRVGGCLIQVISETRPCRLMDDYAPGLQVALDPDRRGGMYGRVVKGGEIAVGDPVELVATEETAGQRELSLGA